MHLQTLRFFGGTPGSAGQALDVVANQGAGVIESKQGIKAPTLELSLTDHTAAARSVILVLAIRKLR